MKMNKANKFCWNSSATRLRLAMRKLWEDHIIYTRNAIISILAGLEDEAIITQRLLRNQEDIGNAVKPYYGEPGGLALTELLKAHIVIAAQLVMAVRDSDTDNIPVLQRAWNNNAVDIAKFLSGANCYWSEEELTNMLYAHLVYTTNEVLARNDKNWDADVKAYDEGHDHMLMFADFLTEGIINQFPKLFKF